MVWKPAKALGLVVGLIIVLTIVGIDVFLVQSIRGQSIGASLYFTVLLFVLSLPLLMLWLYWYAELLSLRYYLDRNALVVDCGTSRHVVPIDAIQRIVPGDGLSISQGFHGIGWPGYMRGQMHLKDLGPLLVHSTEPLERQLVVVTESVCYGISPRDPQRFRGDYASRRALGSIRQVKQNHECAGLGALPVWRDRTFWIAGALALIVNAALFGYIMGQYPGLPERIPLHFNVLGEVDRIASKVWLLVVPGIGTLTLGVNASIGVLVHRRERLGAHLLVCTALGIQAIVALAAIGILRR